MSYSSITIANKFIELAKRENKKLTNMQLQKLVFLANGFSLALMNSPLSYHNIHAWQWGPVFPQLYKSFSQYGSNPIESAAPVSAIEAIPDSGHEAELIESVWKNFGNKTGPQLSALTHEQGSPWETTWNANQYGIIDPNLIKKYYQNKLNVEVAA
jgi:uncharacterized phage-associated protein